MTDPQPPDGSEPRTNPMPVAAGSKRRILILAVIVAIALVGGVGAVLLSTPTPTPTPAAVDPAAPPAPGAIGSDAPVTVEGNRILRDGEPWWFLGYNSFVWSANCGFDEERMSVEDVDAWFASMRHDGHGVVRLFFFEGWDIARLDAAVESAKRHDIYLTITLDDAIAGCGETEKGASWYDNPDERTQYSDHMTMLLERYRGENTIAWFEYFNEPEYADGRLRQFVDEMGAVADQVDPDRLFSSGTIAPYSLDGDENYRSVHESPGVDIASLHEYDFGEIESNHGDDARANAAGKPVIVGEFGIDSSFSGEGCETDFAERAERFRAKVDAYTSIDGYVGAIAWAWQPGSGDECVTGNLDVDAASQDVLRLHLP